MPGIRTTDGCITATNGTCARGLTTADSRAKRAPGAPESHPEEGVLGEQSLLAGCQRPKKGIAPLHVWAIASRIDDNLGELMAALGQVAELTLRICGLLLTAVLRLG